MKMYFITLGSVISIDAISGRSTPYNSQNQSLSNGVYMLQHKMRESPSSKALRLVRKCRPQSMKLQVLMVLAAVRCVRSHWLYLRMDFVLIQALRKFPSNDHLHEPVTEGGLNPIL